MSDQTTYPEVDNNVWTINGKNFTRNEIYEIAKLQSAILYCVLANIVIMLLYAIPVIGQLAGLVVFICSIVFFIKLSTALKRPMGLSVILGILLIVPLLGLILLLNAVITATKVLRAAGLKVGLMGVSAGEREAFRNS